jgi:translocation and assembly module TamA
VRNNLRKYLAAITLVPILCGPGLAADSQSYQVTIDGISDGPILETIRDTSLLASLQDHGAVASFALVQRARADVDRVKTVMESFGYYASGVDISLAGHGIDDDALIDTLDDIPAGQIVPARIAINSGTLYRLGKVTVHGDIPQHDRAALGLSSGDPAVASVVLAGQANLLFALEEDGYAFANVSAPDAVADDAAHSIDVAFDAKSGPQVALGTLAFHGLKDVNEDYVRDALTIHPGDRYKPSAIESARQTLAGLGVFSSVSVKAADHVSAGDTVDLEFDFEERQMHTVSFTAAFSTDLGVSASASWAHHNLLGSGEQLNLSAAINGVGGDAVSGIGYNVLAQFIKPRFLDPSQTGEVDLSALKQDFDAYNQTSETAGVFVRRKFSTELTGSAGLTGTHDQVQQEGVDRTYELLSIPLVATYDTTGLANPLIDPLSGYRASLNVTPTVAFGATNQTFVMLQAAGSAYFDLFDDGQSVLALRGLAASIQGASNVDVPPDQRLYLGGSGSVRGFRYQSIGPRFPDQNPIGATSVDAATIELRQRILDDWGVAAFVDAGQASLESAPFNGDINVGVGIGARYYTQVGAIRLDVAVPVTQYNNRDSFEVYIGLGQAF